VSVRAGQRPLGRGPVQAARLENEAQLVERRRRGELPDTCERELRLVRLRRIAVPAGRVEERLAVADEPHEAGMAPRDHRRGGVSAARERRGDVEHLGRIGFERDGDAPLVDQDASPLHRLGRHVAQHLQTVLRTTDRGTQRHGDRKADHPRAGDAHAHRILEHVGAQPHLDQLRLRAEQLGGPRRTQRHGDRLGAPDGGNHLAAHEVQYPFSLTG
jgi:hypothetical protein